jgi:aspartyl-tRNA(Asn)/glutamyl-tRNA(Gln) amidotransferase subunit C
MTISLNDARHVAKLARLALSDEELNTYTNQLNNILDYAQELQKLNTDGIEPTYHSLQVKTVLREDVPVEFPHKENIIKNGPKVSGTSFVVPKIL